MTVETYTLTAREGPLNDHRDIHTASKRGLSMTVETYTLTAREGPLNDRRDIHTDSKRGASQ